MKMMQDILTVDLQDGIWPVDSAEISLIESHLNALPGIALNLGIRVVMALIFFLVGVQVIKLIRRVVQRALQRGKADSGVSHFLDSLIKAALYVVLFFLIASGFGLDATSVAALLGTAGVAIGLAVQGSLSNLAGGVLIMLLKPFKVGDYIKEDNHGNEGVVKDIDIFYTKLQTVDNKIIVLPNGTLANNSLTNVTACDDRRLDIMIGIAYTADIRKARAVIEKVLAEDAYPLKERERLVYVEELNNGWVKLGVRFWVTGDNYWEGKWQVTEKVKYALEEAGVPSPGNRVEVRMTDGGAV